MGHRPGAEVGCHPGQGLAPRLRPGRQVRNHLVVPIGVALGAGTSAQTTSRGRLPRQISRFQKGAPSTPAPLSSSRKEVKITLSPRSVPGPRTLTFHLGLLP